MVEPRRPWWKRKRWIAVAILWLVVAYPLSMGPVAAARAGGWFKPGHYDPTIVVFYRPADRAAGLVGAHLLMDGYIAWWVSMVSDDGASK